MDATTPPYELPEEGPQPFLRLPWVVSVLAGSMLAIQAALSVIPARTSEFIFWNYGFLPARYSPSFLAAHGIDGGSWLDRALPFVTYMFLHAGWMHVIVNTVWLLAFGAVVVRRFGNLRFLLFFLACGIAGAALHLALNWASIAPVIGASGAISGLMGAAFRIMGREGDAFSPPQPLAPLFSRRILIWSAVWIVINIAAGVTGLGAGPGIQLIAWEAHLGGFAAGLLLSGLFDPVNRLKTAAL
ncbi:MAG TPA: rhomboid family intramembrane serine protease [Rhizomicrobium sp.]|nr:rhomboid family intramembrane serine protease [Rhizomicrobium sp.]